jgi:hypothetical protein
MSCKLDQAIQRDGQRDIGHGTVLHFEDDRVEMRNFGKVVKKMSRRDFIVELPLLAYILGKESAEKKIAKGD